MTDPRNPVDQALDLLLFAPLGFLLEARRLLPELAERGHEQVSNQVTMARMVGRFAVEQGQAQAGKRFEQVQKQASEVLAELKLNDRSGPGASNGTPPASTVVPAPSGTDPSAFEVAGPEPSATSVSTPPSPADPSDAVVTDDDPNAAGGEAADASLAVPDYDSLAASQVIPRLTGLSPAELEAVRAHEVAWRSRKTILNRIAQLQAG